MTEELVPTSKIAELADTTILLYVYLQKLPYLLLNAMFTCSKNNTKKQIEFKKKWIYQIYYK